MTPQQTTKNKVKKFKKKKEKRNSGSTLMNYNLHTDLIEL